MEEQLHVFFLPLIAQGHIIPVIDMAKLFASRGLRPTIISTSAFAQPIKKAQDSGSDIGLILLEFPPPDSGLPDHVVSLDQVTSKDNSVKFFEALTMLQEPVEKLLQEFHPTCLVSDMFLPWTADSAAKFGIPRLVFHGTCYFSLCAEEQTKRHKPFKNVASDSEPFLVPNLPHEVKLVRTQIAWFFLEEDQNEDFHAKLMQKVRESDFRSYGVLVNSFYELEPDYADHYRKALGRRAWNIGPLLLYNNEAKAERGKESTIDVDECLAWLDSKNPTTVVYACFGSLSTFSPAQLHEIARGLEASGHDFIWVVRKPKNHEGESEDWLPQGFVERTYKRGLIIRGWAPQVAILDHPAIGAFVTHCGWNSILEGICAGVPMVTWPLSAEQFFNEKLVTEILGTGAAVGSKKWQLVGNEGVPGEALAAAAKMVMDRESGLEMRSRANYYKEMARKAVQEGGSSWDDMSALIQDLSAYTPPRVR